MLKKATDTLVVALVGFLIAFSTQFWSGYLAERAGSITLGPFLKSEPGGSYLITIENRTSNPIQSVRIMLPVAVVVDSILTTEPLQIETLQSIRSPLGFQTISISSIQAESRVGLQIPLGNSDAERFLVEVVNIKELGFKLRHFKQIETPWRRITTGALAIALLMTLMLGGFSYYMHRLFSGLETQAEEDRKKLSELEEESQEKLNKIREDFRDIRLKNKRFWALQGKIASHYRKELEFWRDTLRSTLKRGDQRLGDAFFVEVSKVLGTYATHGSAHADTESVEVLVEEILKVNDPTSKPR